MDERKKRRRYDDTFKKKAVATLLESGKTLTEVALAVGVDHSILHKWRKKYGIEFLTKKTNPGGNTVGIEEFVSLKKDLASMRESLDQLRSVVRKSLNDKYGFEP